MRVLHVYKDYYPPIHGGIEVVINQIIQTTRAGLQEVRVLVCNREMRTEDEVFDGIRVTKVFDLGRFRSSPLAPTFPLHLKKIASEMDIIHLHSPNPIAGVSFLMVNPTAQLIVHYHSDIVRQKQILKLYRPFLERLLDRANRIIATSPNYIKSSPFLSPREEKCRAIPFGVDLGKFSPTEMVKQEAARIRDQYGKNLVLFVGKMRYYKGLHFLVQAMEKIEGHLLVIGDGPLLGEFLRKRETLSYKEKLSFLGQVDSVVPYYYAARVFCLPSFLRSEAFAVVQIEAAACGLPVVNTQIDSGVPWVCRDGQSGLTVEPENPEALAGAVNQLLKDDALHGKLSQQAKERANQDFTLDVMGQRILDLYGEVLEG